MRAQGGKIGTPDFASADADIGGDLVAIGVQRADERGAGRL